MRLYVPLTQEEFDRLLAFARAERRRPQDQAALFLSWALGAEQSSSVQVNRPTPTSCPTPPVQAPSLARQEGAA
jgi:hypothetical protein